MAIEGCMRAKGISLLRRAASCSNASDISSTASPGGPLQRAQGIRRKQRVLAGTGAQNEVLALEDLVALGLLGSCLGEAQIVLQRALESTRVRSALLGLRKGLGGVVVLALLEKHAPAEV